MIKNNYFTNNMLKNWFISYDPYTDLFQIYDNDVFKMPKSKLFENKSDETRFLITRDTKQPLMIEIKNFYINVGVDISGMSKYDIITVIEPYINKYVWK